MLSPRTAYRLLMGLHLSILITTAFFGKGRAEPFFSWLSPYSSQQPASTVPQCPAHSCPTCPTCPTCPAQNFASGTPFPPYVEKSVYDRKSSFPVFTMQLEYKYDKNRQAILMIDFKKEDVNRCIERRAWDLTGNANYGFSYYGWSTDKSMAVTTVSFKSSAKDRTGYPWARIIAFFKDAECRELIGIDESEADGSLERPAVISMLQADNSRGSDPGRASIYLQGTYLGPKFYTLTLGPAPAA